MSVVAAACCCCCDLLLQVGCVFLPCTLGSSPAHRWNDMPPAYRAAQPGLNHLHIFSVHMIWMWIILNYIGHLPILSNTEWPICGVFHTPQFSAIATTCMTSFRELTTHLCVSTWASLGPSLHVVACCSRNPGCQGKQQGAMIFTQPIEDLWIRMTSELSEVKKQLRECEEQHSSQSYVTCHIPGLLNLPRLQKNRFYQGTKCRPLSPRPVISSATWCATSIIGIL